MSRPGDDHQPTAAVPATEPSADPTADPATGAQAWEKAVAPPTETYPASAPAYPVPDQYGYQAPTYPAPQQYDGAAALQYGQAAPQQYGQAAPSQYGYPPHPGSQYPQPQAAGPYAPGYPYPAREAPMSGLAVASLVCGIVWIYWITSILAIIFAAVALGQIKREGRRGKGLAIAGLVLGLVWVALLVLGLLGALVGGVGSIPMFPG